MDYNNSKMLVASTPEQSLQDYINAINSVYNTTYDSTTIKGTNFWLLFQVNLILLQKQDLLFTTFQSEIFKQHDQMQKEINLSSIGMFLGIKNTLTAFPFVKEVGLKQPSFVDDRAIFGLAIFYEDGYDIENSNEQSVEANQQIANALCLYAGASIHTLKEDGYTTDFTGIIQSIGQPFTHSWRPVVPLSVHLMYEYHLEVGQIPPPLDDLKDNLKKIIENELILGGEFKPQKIANHPYFRFYDRKRLLWSLDGIDFNDENNQTNYFEKWTFEDENIIFSNDSVDIFP